MAAEPAASASRAADEARDDGLDPLNGLHREIRAWIAGHKRQQKEREQENRRRKRDLWSWTKPLLDDLTPRDLYRFRATSTLCHAVEAAGYRVKETKLRGKLTFEVRGRDIECSVMERMTRPLRAPNVGSTNWTAYHDHHQTGLHSSGFLRASITTWLPGPQPQWAEGPRKPFSALIPKIVHAVVESLPHLIAWEKEREEERRRYREEERRRYELRRLKEIDDRRWKGFRTAAANWREKQLVDAFIQELEDRLSAESDQRVGEKTISEWLQWAKVRSNELDPFAGSPLGFFDHVTQP